MSNLRSSAADIECCRRQLIVRAGLERDAMRVATEDLRRASDHIAIIGLRLSHCWLPGLMRATGPLLERARSLLRLARTGLAIWQMMQLLRNPDR